MKRTHGIAAILLVAAAGIPAAIHLLSPRDHGVASEAGRPAETNLDLALLNRRGRVIEASRRPNRVGGQEVIERQLPRGTYVVMVDSFREVGPGLARNSAFYQLTLTLR